MNRIRRNTVCRPPVQQGVRTITLEEHFVTPKFVQAMEGLGSQMPPQMREIQSQLLDLGEARIASMDASSIDVQVLSLAASGLDKLSPSAGTDLAKSVNDDLAVAIRDHPTRFAGLATVAAKDPCKAAKELQRSIKDLGFKGVMLDGTMEGEFYDQPKYFPIFEVAVELDIPIYLHPAPPPEPVFDAYYSNLPGQIGRILSIAGWGWHSETALHTLRLISAGVFDRFPKLKLIIGHMGEGLPFALARSNSVLSGVTKHLQLSVSEYFLRNVTLTTSGFFTLPPFQCALDVVGIDRIMFSVDYPFSPNTKGREFLNSLSLSQSDLNKLTYQNANAILKLSES